MSLVNVINMVVLDNPSSFLKSFSFEITFECLANLQDDLEWKVLYVGSAECSNHDQVLEEVEVGPVPQGIHKFVLQANAPNVAKLPHILGVTVVLVTCTYRDQEFCRIGYYVNNEALGGSDSMESLLDLSKVVRTILADKPRVTRFPIQWDTDNATTMEQYETITPLKHTTNVANTMEMDGPPTVVSPPSTQSMQI